MRIATWNTEWAEPGSSRGRRVAARLAELEADILVVTEGCAGLLPEAGYVIDPGGEWGYGVESERRKVLAWSREPWADVARLNEGAARGRVVRGRTETALGDVTVIAVCIPWSAAHVSTGRCDATRWSEHIECCAQLAAMPREALSVLAGDFNQRIPRSGQPVRAATALESALEGWTVWTAGEVRHNPLIDHIATTNDLVAGEIHTWPGREERGPLSDHNGVACQLALVGATLR